MSNRYGKREKTNKKDSSSRFANVEVTARARSGEPASAPSTPGLTPGGQAPMQLVEQARAAYALGWIQQAQTHNDIKTSELKSFTRRLPGMIQMNGFGQAMAFYYAKREKSAAYREVYALVENWLCGPHDHQQTTGFPLYAAHADSQPALLKAITLEDQYHYRYAQAETQALLRWAKKFAEALLAEDESVHD